MNFERLKGKIALCLLATAPLSLASFSFKPSIKNGNDDVANVSTKDSGNELSVFNSQNQLETRSINFDLTNESFVTPLVEPVTNPRVAEIIEEAKKFSINISSLQTFTDVYLNNDFTNQVYVLLDNNEYEMSTDFLLQGIKSFLTNKFSNTATSQEDREITFNGNLSQENLIVATGLVLQKFKHPLVREAGFFNDYLDYESPERRREVTQQEFYNDSNYESLLNDRGYNAYKYNLFSKILILSIESEVASINSEEELKKTIIKVISEVPELKVDFDRLTSEFRKDQIIDRMQGVIYNAYASDFCFERPIPRVPLNTIGLVYFNTSENERELISNDQSYWLAVNHYGHSYEMYSFLVNLLENNAEELYENSSEGQQLVERLPELYLNRSFMRHKYSFNFLNLANLQNQSDIIATGIYPLSNLVEKFDNVVNLEDYLKHCSGDVNIGETFSKEFFDKLKLLSNDNASELFFFTLDNFLSRNELEPISYQKASNIYHLCQIVNFRNGNFFNGDIREPIRNNQKIDIDQIISTSFRQGHVSFLNPINEVNEPGLKIPARFFYVRERFAEN